MLFEGKRVLVTGGTGSLGQVLTRRILIWPAQHSLVTTSSTATSTPQTTRVTERASPG